MNIKKIGVPQVIMSNPNGKTRFFGWPSVARLQNDKIAVVASGYRYAHICPFGKAVISYSEDEGNTYTVPAPVIDTPLDDRDAGILTFGKSGVIITSFNNSVQFQRNCAGYTMSSEHDKNKAGEFFTKYLDMITPEEESKYLGSDFCISNDCGTTFGEIYKSPVTSPHGPCLLNDGAVLWVGRTFSKNDAITEYDEIQAHKINVDGTTEKIGCIPEVKKDGKKILSCEPHAVQLKDGRIVCHIRVQDKGIFTLYQSVSEDSGRTWSNPEQILEDEGGAPSHLFVHSSGVLIATYGYRKEPYGIKAMFSKDGGKSWDTGYSIFDDGKTGDIGYPCSIELKDKSILTVFYTHEPTDGPAIIMQQKWSFEDEI